MRYASKKGLSTHVCTAKLKDAIQVKKRLIARADSIALPYDENTKEGTLIRGCIYLPKLFPGMQYRKKLKAAPKRTLLAQLRHKQALVQVLFGEKQVFLDTKKIRFIVPVKKIRRMATQIKNIGLQPALVEEYPTEDSFEVEVELLLQNPYALRKG